MRAPRILILCTANSSRSQMAEGLLRSIAGKSLHVFSAGAQPSVVNPLAIRAMAERAIDISHHRSKSVKEFFDQPFDYVITVCDNAAESCPVFLGKAERIHWGFPDPAAVIGTDEERLAAFVRVRNDLEATLKEWSESIMQDEAEKA
jgi:arsenate reductase (thioredoxin)